MSDAGSLVGLTISQYRVVERLGGGLRQGNMAERLTGPFPVESGATGEAKEPISLDSQLRAIRNMLLDALDAGLGIFDGSGNQTGNR